MAQTFEGNYLHVIARPNAMLCLDRLLDDSKLVKRWHLHSHSWVKYVSALSLTGFFLALDGTIAD